MGTTVKKKLTLEQETMVALGEVGQETEDGQRYLVDALCPSKGPDNKVRGMVWVGYTPSAGVGRDSKDLVVAYLKRVGLAGRVRTRDGKAVEEWEAKTA